MKVRISAITTRVRNALSSRIGRNTLIFSIFLGIATMLWLVMALNEAKTMDIRAKISVINVPDSVKLISYIPDEVNINVRATGNDLIAYSIGKEATIQVDYKYYCRQGHISLNTTEIRSLARRTLGQGVQIIAMSPDSLNIWYTSRPPTKLPIRINATVNTLPNCALTRPVSTNIDSVLVYSINPLPASYMSVSTASTILNDVARNKTVRVSLATPPGCRAYPDSVTLAVNVEPMISKSVQVPIRAINVPSRLKMILIPSQITANYTIPMSRYEDTQPVFDITADFNTLDHNFTSNRIKVELQRAEGNFLEVYLSADSVEYIIEQK